MLLPLPPEHHRVHHDFAVLGPEPRTSCMPGLHLSLSPNCLLQEQMNEFPLRALSLSFPRQERRCGCLGPFLIPGMTSFLVSVGSEELTWSFFYVLECQGRGPVRTLRDSEEDVSLISRLTRCVVLQPRSGSAQLSIWQAVVADWKRPPGNGHGQAFPVGLCRLAFLAQEGTFLSSWPRTSSICSRKGLVAPLGALE